MQKACFSFYEKKSSTSAMRWSTYGWKGMETFDLNERDLTSVSSSFSCRLKREKTISEWKIATFANNFPLKSNHREWNWNFCWISRIWRADIITLDTNSTEVASARNASVNNHHRFIEQQTKYHFDESTGKEFRFTIYNYSTFQVSSSAGRNDRGSTFCLQCWIKL